MGPGSETHVLLLLLSLLLTHTCITDRTLVPTRRKNLKLTPSHQIPRMLRIGDRFADFFFPLCLQHIYDLCHLQKFKKITRVSYFKEWHDSNKNLQRVKIKILFAR